MDLDLLQYIDPLPMDQLLYHEVQAVRAWPESAHSELLAVAQSDVAIARQNLAELTRYVDIHAAHLVACSGALDDSIPLMSRRDIPADNGWYPVCYRRRDPSGVDSPVPGASDSYSGQGVLAFWTGQVRTVCLPAQSPFILPISLRPRECLNIKSNLVLYRVIFIPCRTYYHSH